MYADMPPVYVSQAIDKEGVWWNPLSGEQALFQDEKWVISSRYLTSLRNAIQSDVRFRYNRDIVIAGSYTFGDEREPFRPRGWSGKIAYSHAGKPYEFYVSMKNAEYAALGFYHRGNERWIKGAELGATYAFTPYLVGSASVFYGYEEETEENVRAGKIELNFLF